MFLVLIAEVYICLMWNASTQSSLLELVRWVAKREFSSTQILLCLLKNKLLGLQQGNLPWSLQHTHTQLSKEIQWGRQGVISLPYSLRKVLPVLGTHTVFLILQTHGKSVAGMAMHVLTVMSNTPS